MATVDSMAREYVGYLRLNQENPNAESEIAQRINRLTYTNTGQPLSADDRMALFGLMETIARQNDVGLLKEAEDSTQLIKMVAAVRQQAAGKPKGK